MIHNVVALTAYILRWPELYFPCHAFVLSGK